MKQQVTQLYNKSVRQTNLNSMWNLSEKYPAFLNILTTSCATLMYVFAKPLNYKQDGGCPHSLMVKWMDCGIVVSEFVLQSCYYVHFQANTIGKGMNPLILPSMG